MLEILAILAVLAAILILVGFFGAESRPDFLDPRRKHGPFITPFRLKSSR
jgi:hypothetical protein